MDHVLSSNLSAKYLNAATIKGKILGKIRKEGPGMKSAAVSVSHVFKGLNQLLTSENAEVFGQIVFQVRLYYPVNCPLDVQEGSQYLFTGVITVNGELHTSSCSWHAPWDKLTLTQTKGVQTVYKRNCGCRVDCQRWWLPGCRSCDDRDPWGREIVSSCTYGHMYCALSNDWEKCSWKVLDSGYSKCAGEAVGEVVSKRGRMRTGRS
ncbi:predicted protein [Nematostella vectensis]|uniref:NTR domain-containing protein n=1 Tax=Nematostella vectensis TaxID=45351 RepID=A7RL40_NEMVE|nr:predicted protein [Nematostella vectensis]|eukprot:XP_001639857.1 predicted protein [Nematostella vectensis]